MKYRKKPVVVEAWKYAPRADIVSQVMPPAPHHLLKWSWWKRCWRIKTPEDWMDCRPPVYIIRGVKGEFYSCAADIFEATYEPVEDTWP